MTTEDYLTQLQQDKADLVSNLTTQGITGLTGDETFTELVPEVLNIEGGGGGTVIQYVVAGYIEKAILASDWEATGYIQFTLTTENYDFDTDKIQIGLPPSSSTANTLNVVESGLSIALTNSSTNSSTNVTTYTFRIGALNVPVNDIDILIFGITEK